MGIEGVRGSSNTLLLDVSSFKILARLSDILLLSKLGSDAFSILLCNLIDSGKDECFGFFFQVVKS